MSEIVVLSGDGIGPEIMAPTLEVLQAVSPDLNFDERLIGGASIDTHGEPLTDEVLEACQTADAVLLAAVGGPQWDHLEASKRPERGALLRLRKELGADGLYANLRPVRPSPALYRASPLRRSLIEGTDLLIVREAAGGAYFGEKILTEDKGSDLWEYTRAEIQRIARVAFAIAEPAKLEVTSADKANVLASGQKWREVVSEVHAAEFPGVKLKHMLADSVGMALVGESGDFDVILTENTFGDLLSDVAAKTTGSIGMLPSISLGAEGEPCLAEPVHGSAPDIAGHGIANPLAMFLSAALMLRHGLKREAEADAIETAVDGALFHGLRTRDLGGTATTREATDAVLGLLD